MSKKKKEQASVLPNKSITVTSIQKEFDEAVRFHFNREGSGTTHDKVDALVKTLAETSATLSKIVAELIMLEEDIKDSEMLRQRAISIIGAVVQRLPHHSDLISVFRKP
jgi:hypothetical protein